MSMSLEYSFSYGCHQSSQLWRGNGAGCMHHPDRLIERTITSLVYVGRERGHDMHVPLLPLP